METKRQREFIKPTQNQEGENEAKTDAERLAEEFEDSEDEKVMNIACQDLNSIQYIGIINHASYKQNK